MDDLAESPTRLFSLVKNMPYTMQCAKCLKQVNIEDLCWARITNSSGGKIIEAPLCFDCAMKLSYGFRK